MERKTRSYLQLVKPGITLSNTIAAAAGFFLAASRFGFTLTVFWGVVVGVGLIVASACVVNNILDRNIDRRMKRTAKREVASGSIGVGRAALFASLLGIGGFALLVGWTDWLATGLGVLAYGWYIAVYGIAKRTSPLSTVIGSVCGALPPVIGYVAVSGYIGTAGLILFVMLACWQMAHFYAIAIFRRDDYKAAGLPVWSVILGVKSAKNQILLFVILFALLSPLLSVMGHTGYCYLIVMSMTAAFWVVSGVRAFTKGSDIEWARRMFRVSLLVLLVTSASVALGGYLP